MDNESINDLLVRSYAISQEVADFLDEERYRGYIPADAITPFNVLRDAIGILRDDLELYGVVIKTDPMEYTQSGFQIKRFLDVIEYLHPNSLIRFIKDDPKLRTGYNTLAMTSDSGDLVGDIINLIGGADGIYDFMYDACADFLQDVDFTSTWKYGQIIRNLCAMADRTDGEALARDLPYIEAVHGIFSTAMAVFGESGTAPSPLGVSEINKLVKDLCDTEVRSLYRDTLFTSFSPPMFNPTAKILSLYKCLPLHWGEEQPDPAYVGIVSAMSKCVGYPADATGDSHV